MRTSYVPLMYCEKMAVTDMLFHQHAVTEFLVKEAEQHGMALHHIAQKEGHENSTLGGQSYGKRLLGW